MQPLSSGQIARYIQMVPGVVCDELMSKHTSFRLGGPARLYVVAGSIEDLLQAVTVAREDKIPWYVYGGGSNLLVADAGFEGVVIQAGFRSIQLRHPRASAPSSGGDPVALDEPLLDSGLHGNDTEKKAILFCEAGAISAAVARQSVEVGLTGFEWVVGLPGTMGGATYGNAGCYGSDMAASVVCVDTIRLSDGERVVYAKADCDFAYRESLFKRVPHLILSTNIQLKKAEDVPAIGQPSLSGRARLAEIMMKRKAAQPLEYSSGGSMFKNVEYSTDEEIAKLLTTGIEIPASMRAQKSIGAGWIIDKVCHLLGERQGDIMISEKHGNFFVNGGHGRAEDVMLLVSRVKTRVRDELGIQLQEEVQLVGF